MARVRTRRASNAVAAPRRAGLAVLVLVAFATALAACGDPGGGGGSGEGDEAASVGDTSATAVTREAGGAAAAGRASGGSPSTSAPAAAERPEWLGTRVLTLAPGAPPPPTPSELDPRDLVTVDVLPPPADGAFHATVQPVPADVVARSTWHEGCPVALDDLRYVTVSFWGFDDRAHTGELIVHRRAAEPMARAFERLFAARFPIEDMHVTSVAELDAPDTGDGNPTAAFVCRATRGASSWSEHAFGLAVDVNPFQNPYTRDGGVIPGLASAYLDRGRLRPGMIVAGAGVVEAFADMGWTWGGAWGEPDYMHFSANGR